MSGDTPHCTHTHLEPNLDPGIGPDAEPSSAIGKMREL